MATLIFDIETVGEDYAKMDESSQQVLTKWIRETSDSDEEYARQLEVLVKRLGFSPYTAEVVSIALLDYEKDKGKVYFQAPGKKSDTFEESPYEYEAMTEPEMLKKFWHGVENYSDVVTFNGRGFDVPFLMVRSAIYKIRPSVNLMADRYIERQRFGVKHIDLQDQLNFYGAFYKKGGLHMISRAFGIESPKEEGVSGEDVGMLFADGKYEDIARYNARDVIATSKLYEYWDEYIRF